MELPSLVILLTPVILSRALYSMMWKMIWQSRNHQRINQDFCLRYLKISVVTPLPKLHFLLPLIVGRLLFLLAVV